MAKTKESLLGKTFGLYKVREIAPKKNGHRYYYCECQGCKVVNSVEANSLIRGYSKGCKQCCLKARREEKTKRKVEYQKILDDKLVKKTEAARQVKKNKITVKTNLDMFREPLENMLTAYIIKSKAEAQCAMKDIIKIIKYIAGGNEVAVND